MNYTSFYLELNSDIIDLKINMIYIKLNLISEFIKKLFMRIIIKYIFNLTFTLLIYRLKSHFIFFFFLVIVVDII